MALFFPAYITLYDTPMKITEVKIDRESEAALKALLNRSVGTLLSPHADLCHGSSVIAVKHVSIPLAGEEKFVVLECDWKETAGGYDYYSLGARLADGPKGITNRRRAWNHLSFSLGQDQTVTAVEVLQEQIVFAEETVCYDAGIRLTRQDGARIAIVRQESIAGLLEFAALPEDNEWLASDLETRIRYD